MNYDYNFWNKPNAGTIANEIDFIGLHAYAFWNNKTIDEAMDWTESIYRDIQNRYPDHLIAYTETGWPTSRIYDNSYECQLIGKANEQNQKIFFEQYMDWLEENQVICFILRPLMKNGRVVWMAKTPCKKPKNTGVYIIRTVLRSSYFASSYKPVYVVD